MKRIFVTGAAGFTGRYLGERLAGQGHELHGLVSTRSDGPLDHYAELHEGDLIDPAGLSRIVASIRPDKVVHLAAIANVAHDDISQLYAVNIVGTRNLLEALVQTDTPSAVLLASSANVYGNAREGVLDEAVPAAPANDYGVSKLAMESVASIYSSRLPLIIARPFNYTGRGQSPQFIVPKIVDHARRREQRIELGNLDVARDFSDVRTIVDAYARLLSTEAAIGQTLNVCSGRAIELRQVLELVSSLSGFHLEVTVNPAFLRANEVRTLRGSRARIESIIGPLHDIGLEETLRWMLHE